MPERVGGRGGVDDAEAQQRRSHLRDARPYPSQNPSQISLSLSESVETIRAD